MKQRIRKTVSFVIEFEWSRDQIVKIAIIALPCILIGAYIAHLTAGFNH